MPEDPLNEVNEAMTIRLTDESGAEIDAPLLDVQQVLQQHEKEFPILLSSGSAIVLKTIAFRDFKRIRAKNSAWLRQNEPRLVESQRIIEKKDAGEDLTEEEQKALDDNSIDGFPYTSELIHAMIKKPTMTLEDFRSLIRKVWTPEDWTLIQKHATKILQETYIRINPKN